MFQFIKRIFTKTKKKPTIVYDYTKYEDVVVGYWPFTAEELKVWQDQWDKPYNPMSIDISICVPGGYVNRSGEILLRRYKETTDAADRHGDEEEPNGN